jgi:hemolysin III
MKKVKIVEEIFNSILHGIGFFLVIFGFVAFLIFHKQASPLEIAGMFIFCITLMLLYLFSTLLHSLTFTRAQKVFFIFDQSAIFLLIAGSYTAFLMRVLDNPMAVFVLIFVWILAITGLVLNIVFFKKMRFITVITYVLLGWTVLLVYKPVLLSIGMVSFWLLLSGGLFYTLGVFFYIRKFPFSHMIWHIFVFAGSVCQFLSLYLLYV